MRRWKNAALLLILLLLAASPFLYQRFLREKAEKVTVVEATLGTVEEIVSATGSVEAREKVLVNAEPGGRIVALYFREQDRVKKGQVLAKLDDAELSAQLSQAQAGFKLARANLANAEANLQRTRRLYEKEFAARVEVEAAQMQTDLYQTQVEERKTTLELLRSKLERTSIVAPISGIITRKFLEEGGVISGLAKGPGGDSKGRFEPVAIAEIADLDSPEFHVDVDQMDIGRIRIGLKAAIALDAFPGRRFAGTVKEIALTSAERLGGRVQYGVKVKIEQPDVPLRLGMTGTVDFILARKEGVLTLPASVILQRGEGEFVFIVDENRAHLRRITTGLRGEEVVEVISGLKAGEPVVDRGREKVKDGQLVEVLNAKR
ncbi:MAG: efflux RND transporter periplasmic adaptor subunit [Candidatus Methylomirabilales bacterium]